MDAYSPFAQAPIAEHGLRILRGTPNTPEQALDPHFQPIEEEESEAAQPPWLPPLVFYAQLPQASMSTAIFINPENADLQLIEEQVRRDWGLHPGIAIVLVHIRYNMPRLSHPHPTFVPVALRSQDSLRAWLQDLAAPSQRHILDDPQERHIIVFPRGHFTDPRGLRVHRLSDVANVIQNWRGAVPSLYPPGDSVARAFFDIHVRQQLTRLALGDDAYDDEDDEEESDGGVEGEEAGASAGPPPGASFSWQTPAWVAHQHQVHDYLQAQQQSLREASEIQRQDEEDMRQEQLDYFRQIEALRRQRAAMPIVEAPPGDPSSDPPARILRSGQWNLEHRDPSSLGPLDSPQGSRQQRGRTSVPRATQLGHASGGLHQSVPMMRSTAVALPEPVRRLRPTPRHPPSSTVSQRRQTATQALLPPAVITTEALEPHTVPVPLDDMLESPPTSDDIFSALGSVDDAASDDDDGEGQGQGFEDEEAGQAADVSTNTVEIPIMLSVEASTAAAEGANEVPLPWGSTRTQEAPLSVERVRQAPPRSGSRESIMSSPKNPGTPPSKSKLALASLWGSPLRSSNLVELRRASASGPLSAVHVGSATLSSRRPSAPNIGARHLRRVSSGIVTAAAASTSNSSSLLAHQGHDRAAETVA